MNSIWSNTITSSYELVQCYLVQCSFFFCYNWKGTKKKKKLKTTRECHSPSVLQLLNYLNWRHNHHHVLFSLIDSHFGKQVRAPISFSKLVNYLRFRFIYQQAAVFNDDLLWVIVNFSHFYQLYRRLTICFNDRFLPPSFLGKL